MIVIFLGQEINCKYQNTKKANKSKNIRTSKRRSEVRKVLVVCNQVNQVLYYVLKDICLIVMARLQIMTLKGLG